MSSSFILSMFVLAMTVVFFRPLLVGVLKALVLVVRPRLTHEQRVARAQQLNARMVHEVSTLDPDRLGHDPIASAELRASAARG